MNRTDSRILKKVRQSSFWSWSRSCTTGVGIVALSVVLSSCGSPEAIERTLTTENLLGTYKLISYDGQPLPTGNGRNTYYAGELVLKPKQLYTETKDLEACYPARPCTRKPVIDSGTWLLLSDNTLYFDSTAGYGYPPPRVEADGQEIRIYIPDMDTLTFTYRRK